MELHRPGGRAEPEGLRAGGAARELDRAGGQRERVGVPLVGEEARGQPAQERVGGALGRAGDVEPADLRRRAAPDLGARGGGEQLGAEADPERGHAGLERVAQQLHLGAHPREPVRVAHVHAAAEDRDGVERAERVGHRLAGARHPLDELVAVGVAALREQTAGAAAGMPDAQDSHLERESARLQPLHEGQLLLFTGLLLAAGLAASLAAGRLRLPGLVLVLGLGMLIGSDGLGWIDFDDFELARSAGIVAVAMILFEGGLSSGFEEIRPVLRTSVILATLGTLLTAALTAVAAALILDLEPLPALLLGSTVAATDAAAVFAVLRGSTLRRRLARTLEGESGLNDPVAILLVIGCIEAIQHPDFGALDALVLVVEELGIGLVDGPRRRLRSARSGCSACGCRRPACTRWRRSPRPRSPTAPPTACTARGSSRSTSPGSCSAPPPRPPGGRS